MKMLLLSFLVLSSVSAFAKDCSEAMSTAEMVECNGENYQEEDKRLNDLFKKLMAKEDNIGKKKLQTVQRAWIAFRDAECEYQADSERGGSLGRVIRISCLADETKKRADALKDQVEFR
jgi:uncharacterized protein YecT (DUF1311 family)